MSKSLNTLGMVSNIGAQLTDSEFKTLALAIKSNADNRDKGKRAGTTIEANGVWMKFEEHTFGRQLNKVNLFGDYEYIFTKSQEVEVEPIHRDFDERAIDKVIGILDTKVTEVLIAMNDKERAEEMLISEEVAMKVDINRFRYIFRAFEVIGSKLLGIKKTIRKNGVGLSETSITFEFSHNNMKIWKLELPFVTKNGRFEKNGSEYVFNYIPKNYLEYALGEDDVLELLHPYTYLAERLLVAYKDRAGVDVLYEQQMLDNMLMFTNKEGRVKRFQEKIANILNNAKENYWEEKTDSPIMWIDKLTSDYGKMMKENSIGIFTSYDDMIKIANKNGGNFIVRGLDLLTGSTSEPAKRVKLAVGYKLDYTADYRIIVVPKEDNVSALATMFSAYKFENVGTLRTSSKRDNSCTVGSTYQLTKPQNYNKRVKLSYK